ncbi:hypothetical protein ACIQVE_07300 [Pseudomonas sp. NPDC098747]|uniref:hypothetical protein n=1 Tax=Pseudomonas sp. NPDC098747 TaxID=3364487 RepID=UPI00383A74FC
MPLENMPVMKGVNIKSVPMHLLMPYERQAVRNHSRSLQRLAERGGMSSCEILGIIRGINWGELKIRPDDEAELIKWVEKQSAPSDRRIEPTLTMAPASTRSDPASDLLSPLNPLNPISPLNPINQIDSYEPPRSHSPCEPSSSSSSHYSSSSSSSSSDYGSISSNNGSSCSSD